MTSLHERRRDHDYDPSCFGCREDADRRPEAKACSKCRLVKPKTDFYEDRRNGRRYLQSRCKACCVARDQSKTVRAWQLAQMGATTEWYAQMLAVQGGGCAVCGATTANPNDIRRLAIDHDHSTGLLRGLLCTPCNRALGMLKDDPERVMALYQYIIRYGAQEATG